MATDVNPHDQYRHIADQSPSPSRLDRVDLPVCGRRGFDNIRDRHGLVRRRDAHRYRFGGTVALFPHRDAPSRMDRTHTRPPHRSRHRRDPDEPPEIRSTILRYRRRSHLVHPPAREAVNLDRERLDVHLASTQKIQGTRKVFGALHGLLVPSAKNALTQTRYSSSGGKMVDTV